MSNALHSKIIFARRKCSACHAKARSITASISNWIWVKCNRAWPDQNVHKIESIFRNWAKHLVQLNGTAPRDGEMASTDKPDQGIEPGDERNKIEMVANRPTPDTAREITATSSEMFAHGQSRIGHGSVLIAAIT